MPSIDSELNSRCAGVLALLATWMAATTCLAADRPVAPGVVQIGTIQNKDIKESSGVVASRRHPAVFWTHNDGKKAILFALDRNGRSLAEFRVVGAAFEDWEDIAVDDSGRLYLGDIGNNDAKRRELAVYQVEEPDPKTGRGAAKITRGWRLRFAGKPFDCESLFILGTKGYIVSKVFDDAQAELYRFSLAETGPCLLERICALPITSPVTGADLSPGGDRLAVIAKAGPYVFQINGDVAQAGRVPSTHTRFKHDNIEGCCFAPEGLLATAESKEIYLFTNPAFRQSAK